MFLLSCLSEITGYLIAFFGSQYSRKSLMMISLILSGIFSLPVAMIPPPDELDGITLNTIFIMAFASLAKVFCSTSLYLMYHYASLLFPTSVRNTLVSYASCMGRLGSIIAPQINLLRFIVWAPLPYYIFSFNTLLASCAVFFLPNDKKTIHNI